MLAFETGDAQTAREHMTAGHTYAQEHNEDWLISNSAKYLEELDARIANSD